MTIKRATIKGFQGSWSSGLAFLLLEGASGTVSVPCDNGPTVRALRIMFDGAKGSPVIGEGHTVNVEAFTGLEVGWDYDEMGLCLGWLAPACAVDWDDLEQYE